MNTNERKAMNLLIFFLGVFPTWLIVHSVEHRIFIGNWGNDGDSGFQTIIGAILLVTDLVLVTLT